MTPERIDELRAKIRRCSIHIDGRRVSSEMVSHDELDSMLDAAEAVAAMERWNVSSRMMDSGMRASSRLWVPMRAGRDMPQEFWWAQHEGDQMTWPTPTAAIFAAAAWLEQERKEAP